MRPESFAPAGAEDKQGLDFTSDDLDRLRADVASLHYELDPNLNIIPPEQRSRHRAVHYAADLVSNAIRASLPLLKRKGQRCCFEGHRSDIPSTGDPIDTMMILTAMLRIMARESQSGGCIRVRLTTISGRTAIILQSIGGHGGTISGDELAQLTDHMVSAAKYTCSIERERAGNITLKLLLPFRMN